MCRSPHSTVRYLGRFWIYPFISLLRLSSYIKMTAKYLSFLNVIFIRSLTLYFVLSIRSLFVGFYWNFFALPRFVLRKFFHISMEGKLTKNPKDIERKKSGNWKKNVSPPPWMQTFENLLFSCEMHKVVTNCSVRSLYKVIKQCLLFHHL